MSRASSYRTAAVDLWRASAQFTDIAASHRRLDASVIGAAGAVAVIHDRSVEAVGAHLAKAAGEADRLAVECERRADVCDEYDRQLRSWLALPWTERLLVAPPFPSAAWVVG